jgi:hypothetical protein
LAFAATVIAQNVVRGATMPANDASAADVIAFYADHRAATVLLAVLFPIGAVGLAVFSASVVSRLVRSANRVAALAGATGVAAIICLFSMTLAIDLGLSGYVHRGGRDPDVVAALWTTHNAVFGVLLIAIGVALGGLSFAMSGEGLIGRAWRPVGLAGAAALAVASASTPAIVDGSPVMFLGVAGFLVWVAFVLTASRSLWRTAPAVAS